MGTYFQLRRRKFGIVTLMLACLLVDEWIRSTTAPALLDFHVLYDFPIGTCQIEAARSDNHSLEFLTNQFLPTSGWHEPADELHGSYELMTVLTIPYWKIVVPLTLVSAWLLLSKPRMKTD